MAKIYKKAWLSVYESHAFLLLLFCFIAFCYIVFYLIVLLFASLFQQLFKI